MVVEISLKWCFVLVVELSFFIFLVLSIWSIFVCSFSGILEILFKNNVLLLVSLSILGFLIFVLVNEFFLCLKSLDLNNVFGIVV